MYAYFNNACIIAYTCGQFFIIMFDLHEYLFIKD